MTHGPDHVSAHAQRRDGIVRAENRLYRACFSFTCPYCVIGLLEPAIAHGKGFMSRKLWLGRNRQRRILPGSAQQRVRKTHPSRLYQDRFGVRWIVQTPTWAMAGWTVVYGNTRLERTEAEAVRFSAGR